jgi:LysM repeat protein
MPTCKRIAGVLLATFIVCMAVPLAASPAEAQDRDCGGSVILGFGETLSAIARRCGVSVNDIMDANPLIPNPNFVFPGLRIRLPEMEAPARAERPRRYVVRAGDTLYSIARANEVQLQDIYRLNPDIDGRTMRIGDVVLLPRGEARPVPQPEAPTVRYRVRRGDTLRSIARDNDVEVRDIVRLNPDMDPRDLQAGDVLILPGAVAAPPPPPPPATNTVRYTVRPGDTLYSIARANGMTVRQIIDLNPALDTRALRAGEVVLLRGGIVPPSPPQPRIATSVSPQRGAPGTIVEVAASGFPPAVPLRLLAGSQVSTLQEFQQVTSDRSGSAKLSARIPAWAAAKGTLVFAFETQDGRLRAVSDTFRVTSAPQPSSGTVSVVGTLTREGVECQAMRGDDGKLYTLPGDLPRGFGPGDRVRVVGEVAEASYCQQGTTISRARISQAN